jgi:Fe-S cluster biogenesis protein NfuA
LLACAVVGRIATETDEKRRSVMIANMKNIPKQARPALQVGGGDVNLVNVNNKVAGLKLKGVHDAAQRRNHV